MAAAGAFSPAAAARALELASGNPPAELWLRYLRRGLLVLGASLALAGVIFFFAYNWAALGRFEKLGLISAAIVAAAVTGWQRSGSLVGNVALFAGSILVGALLAVYGQAYQTGADPFELFVAWMLLILPWTVAARTPAFFTLQLVLANVALSLFWVQVLDRSDRGALELLLVLFGLNALALLAHEALARPDPTAPHWFTRLLATVCCGLLLGPTVGAAIGEAGGALGWLALLSLVVALAGVSLGFGRGPRKDLYVVAVFWASALVPLDAAITKSLFDGWVSGAGPFFLLGLLVMVEVGALVTALRGLARAQPTGGEAG